MKSFTIKKITTLIFTALQLAVLTGYSSAQYKVLDYDFPLPSSDFGKCVVKRLGGSFAMSGFSYSYPPGFTPRGYDWFFSKLNEDGTVERTKLYGFSRDNSNADFCFSLTQLSGDSNFVLAGAMTHTDNKRKATFIKVNKFGNVVVSKRINDTLQHEYHQVITCPSDTLVFAGFTEEPVEGAAPNKILVGKYLADGSRQWIFRYAEQNSTSTEKAYSVCYQSSDKSYAVASSYGSQRIVILKLNRLGQIVAQRTFGFPNELNYITEARKIIPMTDGGFVVIGFTQAFDDIAMDIWVLRVEADLDVVWSEIYGNKTVYEEGHSIINDNDTLVFTGFSGRPATDMIVVKIPSGGGAPIWSNKYDISSKDAGYEIIRSAVLGSESYSVIGQKDFPGGTGIDALLIHMNLNGDIPGTTCLAGFNLAEEEQTPVIATPNFTRKSKFDVEWSPTARTPVVNLNVICEGGDFLSQAGNMNEIAGKFSLSQNYPNPFNPSTIIKFSIAKDADVSIKVYDLTGREVAELVNGFKNKGSYSIQFNASKFSSGVYFYKLRTEGFEETKKMILVK
jgi:hypothetical protein